MITLLVALLVNFIIGIFLVLPMKGFSISEIIIVSMAANLWWIVFFTNITITDDDIENEYIDEHEYQQYPIYTKLWIEQFTERIT